MLIYRTAIRKYGSGHGYVDFSYDNIQSRFACYHCLNEWRLQYERYINGELAWGNRHYISGSESDNNYYFAFISGYQKASNGSINIKLNIGDYAVHPDRKGVGGFRCKDKKPLGHNADSALMFTGDKNESNWEQFLILHICMKNTRLLQEMPIELTITGLRVCINSKPHRFMKQHP